MNQNNLTFYSENLVVDWISFKFQHLEDSTKKKIANYLFKFGFNSYKESGKLAKPVKESILVSSNNQFEVCFVENNSYWQGTLLQFSGLNAKNFYSLIQQKLVPWKLFSSATLGRFDIYYSRNHKQGDKISVRYFFENSHKKLQKTNKNVSYEKNSKGLILKIGNRKSNHYSRIYEGRNYLKFEYEIKGQFLRKYHSLLIENNLEEFENKLSKRFLYNFGKLLPLQYSYLDWLVVKLRPIKKQLFHSSSLQTHYLQVMDFTSETNRKSFFTFLQFLRYAQDLDYETGFLGSTPYRRLIFPVQDFLKYKKESNNYYQLKKLIEFFDQLQSNSFIKFFSDTQYRSLVTIPEVQLEKSRRNSWIAKVWIAEELFYYKHPFFFPDLLQRKPTKHEFEVLFKIIQVFSSVDLEKTFYIKEFLQNYPSTLTNKQITKIKKYFLQIIQIFQEHQLIDSNYKIISNGKLYDKDQLTSRTISEGFVVYEKLYI